VENKYCGETTLINSKNMDISYFKGGKQKGAKKKSQVIRLARVLLFLSIWICRVCHQLEWLS
jgi:hypothetical protein